MATSTQTPSVNDPIANIKPFAYAAGLLISLGMGWSELNARIAQKAEQAALEAVERRVELNEQAAAAESRINRILLCRLPEIRPDSHCEGYR